MGSSRLTGTLLMVTMAAQVVLFLIGAARRSYTALAIPIALMVTFLSVLGFWVGWTLASMEDDLAGLEFEAEPLDDV